MFYNMDSSLISNLLIRIINSYESFKKIPTISEHFRRFSENFWKSQKCVKDVLINHFESFPKILEHVPHFQRFSKIFQNIWKVLKMA